MEDRILIDRLYAYFGINPKRGQYKLANKLGLSPSNFNNKKKRGTLINHVSKWAIENSVNLDLLLSGDGISKELIEPKSKKESVELDELKSQITLLTNAVNMLIKEVAALKKVEQPTDDQVQTGAAEKLYAPIK